MVLELLLFGIHNHANPDEFMKALEPIINFSPDAVFIEEKTVSDSLQSQLYDALLSEGFKLMPVMPDDFVFDFDSLQESLALLEYGYAVKMAAEIHSNDYSRYAFPVGSLHLGLSDSPINYALKLLGIKANVIIKNPPNNNSAIYRFSLIKSIHQY